MILCGFLLPILAVPMGLELFILTYFQNHLELRLALEVMAIPPAVADTVKLFTSTMVFT